MQLTENVFVETGFRGANVSYIITEEGIVMIDSPYKPTDAVKWRSEIESKGSVSYLINTESHADHYTGNSFFSVPVISSGKTREEILARNTAQLLEMIGRVDPDGVSLMDGYQVNAPSITFSGRMTLYEGGHSFRLMHLPGHTVGQSAVFVPEEKVVFTGDNVCGNAQSFFHEADPFSWLESLKRINELGVDHVVSGHGEVVGKNFITEQADYVQECIDTVKKGIDRGMTKDEAVANLSLPSRYPLEKGQENAAEFLFRGSIANLYDVLSR